jgi:hypothetical protein
MPYRTGTRKGIYGHILNKGKGLFAEWLKITVATHKLSKQLRLYRYLVGNNDNRDYNNNYNYI